MHIFVSIAALLFGLYATVWAREGTVKLMGEEIKFIAINLTAPPELEEVSFL